MIPQVRIVALTSPEVEDVKNIREFIAFVARVSNPANQLNTETSEKLLNYLIKHKHWSPFEMAHVVLEIVSTRDIIRQILRHRSFSYQEFSQRYAEATTFHTSEARLQDKKNRQNSLPVVDEKLQEAWENAQQHVIRVCNEAYRWALSQGIAKEVARKVLPEGLTESRIYMAGSLRSWIHYLEVRDADGVQKEHRDIAIACKKALLEQNVL